MSVNLKKWMRPITFTSKGLGCRRSSPRRRRRSSSLRMTRSPEVKWAQSIDKVYITVQLADARDVKVNLEPDGIFTFSATAGAASNFYELKFKLFDKVNKEESKINVGVRSIFCVIEKAEKQWWKKLIGGEGKTPHYVKVDWDKWVDEDDDGRPDLDLGGMDFSNFGDMGGNSMDDDFEDSDDEEPTEKTEHAPGDEKIKEASSEDKKETD